SKSTSHAKRVGTFRLCRDGAERVALRMQRAQPSVRHAERTCALPAVNVAQCRKTLQQGSASPAANHSQVEIDATGSSRRLSVCRECRMWAQRHRGCHGLVPWSFTFVATENLLSATLDATGSSRGLSCLSLMKNVDSAPPRMPRARPVVFHVCRYRESAQRHPGCHGLVPWSFMFVANEERGLSATPDATGSSRGLSRLSLQRICSAPSWMPRARPVVFHVCR